MLTFNACHVITSVVLLDLIWTLRTCFRILMQPLQTRFKVTTDRQIMFLARQSSVPRSLVNETGLLTTMKTRDNIVRRSTVVELTHLTFDIRAPDELVHLFKLMMHDEAIVSLREFLLVVVSKNGSDRFIVEGQLTIEFRTVDRVRDHGLESLLDMLIEAGVTDGSWILATLVMSDGTKESRWLWIETYLTCLSRLV